MNKEIKDLSENLDQFSGDQISDKVKKLKLIRKYYLEQKKAEFYGNLYTRKTLAFFIGVLGLVLIIFWTSYFDKDQAIVLGTLWVSGMSAFSAILGVVNTVDKKNFLSHQIQEIQSSQKNLQEK